jgi:hypothetical protein
MREEAWEECPSGIPTHRFLEGDCCLPVWLEGCRLRACRSRTTHQFQKEEIGRRQGRPLGEEDNTRDKEISA